MIPCHSAEPVLHDGLDDIHVSTMHYLIDSKRIINGVE